MKRRKFHKVWKRKREGQKRLKLQPLPQPWLELQLSECNVNRLMYPKIVNDDRLCQRPGEFLFNAGCNEQVFSPKPCKKLAQIRAVVFVKNAKTAQLRSTPIPKK